MKTYLLDTFNRYKRFSEELDAKTILCNKSWWVFNDSGEKEIYIFNNNGTLIISVSGRVTNATWQYISANKSLIISGNNQSYMVHPAFYDNMIFALQVDGTNEYAFLIDENNLPSTSLRSLDDLNRYFRKKEKKELNRRRQERRAVLEEQRTAIETQRQIELEREEAENRREEAIKRRREIYWKYFYILFPLAVVGYVLRIFLFMRNTNFSIWTLLALNSGIITLLMGEDSIFLGIAILYVCYFIFFVISKIAIFCLDYFNLARITFNWLEKRYIIKFNVD